MATINNKNYSSPRNINLKEGCLRFGTTNSSNPFGDESYGVYVDASGNLIYRNLTTSTTLGAAGSGGTTPSWDAIIAGDQTLQLGALSTFTIDRNSGNNDILTITNTGAGSGDCIQITNVGTGNDIEGTDDTWHFSKAGDATLNKLVMAGDATADSFTLTAGDMVASDGSLTITDADNAATLSITNNTATSASVFVFAGSGTFTGSTTTSFMTVTPSGLTTGTAVYLPLAAMTTGTGLHVVCDTVTSGKVVHIASAVTGTTMTANGRLFYVEHTGTGTTSVGALAEVTSAAADETIIMKVTASGALALGNILKVSGSSMTTGSGIAMSNLDSLTTGIGLHIASSATAIAGAGRLLYVNHTGATSTSGILAEMATSATDETTILKLTSAAMVDGINLNIVGTTGMTTGSLIRATSSTAAAVATNGIYSFALTGAFTSTAATLGAFHIAGSTTVTGTIASILGGAQTTGVALSISDGSGTTMTSGSLLRVATATTGAVATNGIVSIKATGAYTSTSNVGLLDVGASGTVTGTVVHITSSAASQTTTQALNITQSGATLTAYTGDYVSITGGFSGNSSTGSVVCINGVNTTAGSVLKLANNALTTGTMFTIAHTTSVIADTGSIMRLSSSSVDTGGSTNGTILDISSTGSVAGTLVKIKSNVASQTSTCLLDVVAAGYTTGYTGSVVKMTGVSTEGSGSVLLVTGANTTAGETVKIDAAGVTTGTGLLVTSAGVIITTGELVSLVANAATTCTGILRISGTALTDGFCAEMTGGGATATASGGVLNLNAGAATNGAALKITTSGVYVGTVGVVDINASSATTGDIVVIDGTGLTTGSALRINATTATLSTGFYIECNNGTGTDFSIGDYGATIIAGSALGTAALTITAGDLVLSDGTIAYKQLTETVAATNTLTAAESGKTCFLGHATEFVTTLPAVAAGLHFKFIVSLAPSGASYTIVTPAGADLIYGNIVSSADAGGSADSTAGTKADTITFADGQAAVGDWVEVICDGTYWYAFGICGDEDAITLTAT